MSFKSIGLVLNILGR